MSGRHTGEQHSHTVEGTDPQLYVGVHEPASDAGLRPVLLLHGDTHRFRADRPLLASHGLANLYRVECFGSPFSSAWVSIRWNPAAIGSRSGNGTHDPFEVSSTLLRS